jgi:hypothetical protein
MKEEKESEGFWVFSMKYKSPFTVITDDISKSDEVLLNPSEEWSMSGN